LRPPPRTERRRLAATVLALALATVPAACARDTDAGTAPAATGLEPADFSDLPGWSGDSQAAALPALRRSCDTVAARPAEARMRGPSYAGAVSDWRNACAALDSLAADDVSVRTAIEAHFVPWRVPGQGLFTGYYEAALRGAIEPSAEFPVPIHARPAELVEVKLAGYRPHPSVTRFVGLRAGTRLVRFPDRAAIENGAAGALPVIAWVDDPVDAFFLHIQGSGVVELRDGSRLRVGYAAHNGHPYVSIGAKMIERGLIDRDGASAQTMAAWMRANPEEAAALIHEYPRYVFFEAAAMPDATGEELGPKGALGVPLTAGRSLAVDPEHVPLGAPVWLDTTHPLTDEPLRRLVAAQDTGGAIKGAVRGDLFWGTGDAALERAGRMKERGRYWVLLPRGLDPAD